MVHKPDTDIRAIYNSRSGTWCKTISTLLMRKDGWRSGQEGDLSPKEGEKWRLLLLLLLLLFESGRNRSSTRSITTARNDGNSAYCPPRGTSRRATRNYARRPSRDGDNSLFRLRSLIERQTLSLPHPLCFLSPPSSGGSHRRWKRRLAVSP